MIRLIIVAAASVTGILFVAYVASRVARSRRTGLSIRLQVFLALAAVVGAFAFGLGVMVVDRVQARTVRFATQAATEEAASIARLLSVQVQQGSSLTELARQLSAVSTGNGVTTHWQLRDERGTLLFQQPGASQEQPLVSASARVLVRGNVVGRVEVHKPTLVVERLLRDFAPTVLVISLVLGAAAALAAAWIGRSIAAPIEALSRFSERVSRGLQGAHPPPRPWGREVTRLTDSIDSMRRQLEGRPFAEMFATDLSHELKNPVAAIRASAEVLQEGALQEPERAQHFVGRIREAVGRIERLLGELLRLARLEAGRVEELSSVSFAHVLDTALEQVPGSERVRVHSDKETRLLADPTWLQRAVLNLLDNALIHSPPGTPVVVSLQRSQQHLILRVENAGEVHHHVRRNLFRRFVTTREDKGGTGLGLAIVRAVAEAHGGQVELEDSGPPKVRFRLTLPLRPTRAIEEGSQPSESPHATPLPPASQPNTTLQHSNTTRQPVPAASPDRPATPSNGPQASADNSPQKLHTPLGTDEAV